MDTFNLTLKHDGHKEERRIMTTDRDRLRRLTSSCDQHKHLDLLTHADDDVALMQRIAKHDHEAFEILYKRYKNRLHSFLWPFLFDTELVNETINIVMLVVWQKAGHFHPSAKLSTWMFGIARNKALKALKSSGRQDLHDIDEEISEVTQLGPEYFLMQQQQHKLLTQAVQELPSNLKDVIEGIYYLALTYPDLANRLGCSISTVKTRKISALRRLATLLRQARRQSNTGFASSLQARGII
jgi:RNA polymerase sigma-70 factor (ECF subfamily)